MHRLRKSRFVKLFDKTPVGVLCPHFYELILSNGCPFECLYCYLNLTFRGNKKPVLFTNSWQQVERELNKIPAGVFSTGELADSLAILPPLLGPAIEYFRKQTDKFLLLTTKSVNIKPLLNVKPTSQVWISFSVNPTQAWSKFELRTPHPHARIKAAQELKNAGWRIRIRIDPVIGETGIDSYEEVTRMVRDLNPDMVTVGTLRHFPGLFRFQKQAPRNSLRKSSDGRMRYPLDTRASIYTKIAEWLQDQPGLCKETSDLWNLLGWKFKGCNCTIITEQESHTLKSLPQYYEYPHSSSTPSKLSA